MVARLLAVRSHSTNEPAVHQFCHVIRSAALIVASLTVFSGCSVDLGEASSPTPSLPDMGSVWDALDGTTLADTAEDTAEDTAGDTLTDADVTSPPDIEDADTYAERDTLTPDLDVSICESGLLRCVDLGMERCVDGVWETRMSCPLGCNEVTQTCYVASNVDMRRMQENAPLLDLELFTGEVFVNTDTGAIWSESSVVRIAGEYESDQGRIGFKHVKQDADAPGLGVFSVGGLLIPTGVVVEVQGSRGFVVVASGDIVINGVINVSAHGHLPGPGGWGGGELRTGDGPCPGETAEVGTVNNTSGGGGGGFGGAGGDGGLSTKANPPALGDGGGECGGAFLRPLTGGSGGGGGGSVQDKPTYTPGIGGGGGGAIQLVSSTSIVIHSGGIHAAGDGGGECFTAGGGGGGAGDCN